MEDALWTALQAGVKGEISVREALQGAYTQIEEILEGLSSQHSKRPSCQRQIEMSGFLPHRNVRF